MAHRTRRNSNARLRAIEIESSISDRKTVVRVRLATRAYVEHEASTWRFLIATTSGSQTAWRPRLNWRSAGSHHAIWFIPTYWSSPTHKSNPTVFRRWPDHATL